MAAGELRRRPVTVVVVTHQSEEPLPGLVGSLQAGMEGLEWSLVVVDNASTDRSVALVRSLLPRARVVECPENRGFAAGVNAGSAHARAETDLLLLNPDARLEPGCAAEMTAALGRFGDAEAGIVVPR